MHCPGFGHVNFANFALLNGCNGRLKMGTAPLGQSCLDNDARLAGGCFDLLASGNCQGDRLLQINVLASPAGCHGNICVPMIRSGDNDSIEIGAVEDRLMFADDNWPQSEFLVEFILQKCRVTHIDIAQGSQFHVGAFRKQPGKLLPVLPSPNNSQADS